MAGRRGSNEGSIWWSKPSGSRKYGRWEAAVSTPTGRISIKGRKGDSRKDVHDRLAEAVSKAGKGMLRHNSGTLAAYLSEWLRLKKGLRRKTRESYANAIHQHVIPAIGSITLAKLTTSDIRRLISAVEAKNLSAHSVRKAYDVLARALNAAVREDLIPRNVAKLVAPPTPPVTAGNPLPQDSLDTVRAALKAHAEGRHEALFLCILMLGLRRGEALGLKWGDIDFQARTLSIRRQLDEHRELQDLKTEKSKRTLMMPGLVSYALQSHRVEQKRWRMRSGDLWQDTGLVFTTFTGGPLGPRNVLRSLQTLLAQCGIARRRIHDFRHTTAHLLLADGAELHEVSALLGHASLAFTANVYGHLVATNQRTADRMDRIVETKKP
jgi:integrase